jgi:hypothetical protein
MNILQEMHFMNLKKMHYKELAKCVQYVKGVTKGFQ